MFKWLTSWWSRRSLQNEAVLFLEKLRNDVQMLYRMGYETEGIVESLKIKLLENTGRKI